MSRTFQIHPHGFLGAVSPDAHSQALSRIDTTRLSFGSFHYRSDVKYPHNRDVADLFHEYQTNLRTRDTFQFYERVLGAALKCFGTDDFFEWLAAQAQAETTDYLHARFLKDTVRFIFGGNREMMIDQWQQLLSNNREMAGVIAELPRSQDAFREMLAYAEEMAKGIDNDERVTPKYRRVIYVIFEWVKRPNGIADLLKTMNILFGK